MPDTAGKEWADKFYALQEEAYKYGIESIVAIESTDTFTGMGTFLMSYKGGFTACVGLAGRFLNRMRQSDSGG